MKPSYLAISLYKSITTDVIPLFGSWGTVELEYFENLIYLTISTVKCFFFNKFCKNAANSPNINSKTILFLSKQDFGCAVPKSFNLMS